MLEVIKIENLHTDFWGFDNWNFEFIWNLEIVIWNSKVLFVLPNVK
jgi:hypothetical protein